MEVDKENFQTAIQQFNMALRDLKPHLNGLNAAVTQLNASLHFFLEATQKTPQRVPEGWCFECGVDHGEDLDAYYHPRG